MDFSVITEFIQEYLGQDWHHYVVAFFGGMIGGIIYRMHKRLKDEEDK